VIEIATVTVTPNTGTAGKPWAELRTRLRLSRENFAQRAGLTPGAVWRIEAKGRFKPGELEKLHAVFGDQLAAGGQTHDAPQTPAPASVAVPVPDASPQDELVDPDTAVFGPAPSPGDIIVMSVGVADPTVKIVGDLPPVVIPEPVPLNLPELSPYELSLRDGVRRYSNSEIQTFKRCLLKWYMGYYLRYTPRFQSPVGARAIGDRLHRALRWHYHPDLTQRRDVRDALEQIIKIDTHALTEHHAPDIVPLSLETKFRQEADLERVMVAGYVEWLAETGADAEFIVTGAEEYVEVPLELPDGTVVRLVGRLDARMRRIGDGALLFMDHKSVGGFDGPTRVLTLNEQMKTYLVIETLLNHDPDVRVDGAIFNMLRRSKRTPTARPPFYMRVEVRHNVVSIGNFTRQLQTVITRIEEVRRALDEGTHFRQVIYPTPAQDCTWSCDFLPLDTLIDDGSHWEAMAQTFFQVGDPTGYYVRNNEIPSLQ